MVSEIKDFSGRNVSSLSKGNHWITVLVTACVYLCVWLVPVEDMPIIDGSQCHGKAGPQGLVVHFNSYFQTVGNFLEIGNTGLSVVMFPL